MMKNIHGVSGKTFGKISMVLVAFCFVHPAQARAPSMAISAPAFVDVNEAIPVANKLQKALKSLKKPFKKAPQTAPSGPARQPGLNQIFDRNAVSAPNAPQRAPSQAASSAPSRSNSGGSAAAPSQASNPYGVIPPPRQASQYDLVEAPQFPNGPYANVPIGRANKLPATNSAYGSANPTPNGPYGNIPRGQFPNGPYGNVPVGQFPNGPYGNVPVGQFPNGPYGNIPNGQQLGNGGYTVVDPKIFRDNAGGTNRVTSPGYDRFDTNLFKNSNGLPAQIRRLPTQRLDVVAPKNSPAQLKQAADLRALDKGIARDGRIIKGATVGIIGSGLVLGGLGAATIVDMTQEPKGDENNE